MSTNRYSMAIDLIDSAFWAQKCHFCTTQLTKLAFILIAQQMIYPPILKPFTDYLCNLACTNMMILAYYSLNEQQLSILE